MKKIFLYSLTILGVSTIAFFNIYLTTNSYASNIVLANIEALASNGEYAGWDNFFQGQGFYKDEREWVRQCPSEESTSGQGSVSGGGVSIGGGGSSSTTSPSTREEITCPYGDDNCTEIEC